MRIRSAASIVREGCKKSAIAKRKNLREEIKAANDNDLKSDVSHMIYILGLRRQMKALSPAEDGALEILREANSKRRRFCAIRRVKKVVYK